MATGHDRILLFDGVCNLCNGTVQLVLRADGRGRIKFAALQSPAGRELLQRFGLPVEDFESFVYIRNGKCYRRSSAALRVARDIGGLWSLLYAFIIIPAPVRDAVYNIIARSRYRIFGRREACMVPGEGVRERFL